MGLTGLFLIGFLIIHLLGNIPLLYNDGGQAFNEYAHFMKTSKIMVIGEVVLFSGFIFHIAQGINLIIQNKKARPVAYKIPHKNKKVDWRSKSMGAFGIIILVFFIIHLGQFFSHKYFIPMDEPPVTYEGVTMDNLYEEVLELFTGKLALIWVAFYGISMMVVGFHLHHGFQSAFQTFGINSKKYTPTIKAAGIIYAVLVPLMFALIPLLMYLGVKI